MDEYLKQHFRKLAVGLGIVASSIFINNENRFLIKTDTANFIGNAVLTGTNENKLLFDYLKFIMQKTDEFTKFKKGLVQADSTEKLNAKSKDIDVEVKAYQHEIIKTHPESFMKQLLTLQQEPEIPEAPVLGNRRKDSTFAYRYYKEHYWDGVDFSDEKNLHTPFFHDKLKIYINTIIIQHPDSIIKETDKLVEKTNGNKEMFKHIVWLITNNFGTSTIMGMDAIYIHSLEKYYKTGQAFWVDSTDLKKMIERCDILKPLLLNNVAPDLQMIDTTNLSAIEKLGFMGITTSEELTKKYYENIQAVNKLSTSLYHVKAKYTILLFWHPSCGYCKQAVPKIKKAYDDMKSEKIDVETFAVLTEDEYSEWKAYIKEHSLNWINVTDPVHLNNINKKYDINSTPVIYILDENKRIIAKKLGAEQIEDFIKRQWKK